MTLTLEMVGADAIARIAESMFRRLASFLGPTLHGSRYPRGQAR